MADVTVDPAVENAVKKRLAEIKAAEKHFEKPFKQMLDDQQYARGKQWGEGGHQNYVVNITLRHIQTRTAGLYAKNPKVQVKRQPKIDGIYWDGEISSLQEAQQRIAENMQMGLPPDAMDQAIVQEADQINQQRAAIDRVGKSLLLIQNHFLDGGFPTFKEQAKQCLRQALTCGVGYIKIGFHRPGEVRPEPDAVLGDVAERQARVQGIDEEAAPERAEAEQALFIASLEGDGGYVEPEGLIYTWPSPTMLIPDPKSRSLIGWQGTRWVAEKFYMTKEEIKEIYGVDLKDGAYTPYSYSDIESKPSFVADDKAIDGDKATACVYEVWDKARGTVETVCEGYQGYLRPPAAPMRIEGFFPYRALVLNDVADDKCLFPPSDVFLLRDMQEDTNRARQGIREHRLANRPRQIVPEGVFDEEDEKRLAEARAHDVIKAKVAPGTDLRTIIQAAPTVAITQELYDTAQSERDILRVVGSQEANFGPTGGATATEVGVAESSRQTAMASQMDDLDLFLGTIMRASGQILLRNLSPERAREIAGPGAAWPEWDGEAIAGDLILSIKSGSSGMPNQAQQAANLERLLPFAIQMPGFNPTKMSEKIAEGMGMADDLLDLIDSSQPSILALNALAGAGAMQSAANASGAPPDRNPTAQGSAGSANSPRGMGRPGGPMAGMPAPQEGF